MRRRTKVLLAVAPIAMFLGVNLSAYMQARAMTHFTANGNRTKSPEDLNILEAVEVLVVGVNIPRPENTVTPASVGLSFEVTRFPAKNGVILEAWHIPGELHQPIVILFHGYAVSKSALLPVAQAIHELGYATLLVDFYGSGGSSGSDTSLGYLEAGDVAATTIYARQTWPGRKIVLYGFSMGGAAILRAVATEGVKPDAIILEATFDTLLNTVKNRFRTMSLPATPLAQLLLSWGGFQWGFNPFTHNPVAYSSSVACPTLILHGEEDARVPLAEAQSLRQAIGSATLVTFPAVSHMLIVVACPDPWKSAIRDFLSLARDEPTER